MKIEKKCKFITAITHVLNAQNPSRNPSAKTKWQFLCIKESVFRGMPI